MVASPVGSVALAASVTLAACAPAAPPPPGGTQASPRSTLPVVASTTGMALAPAAPVSTAAPPTTPPPPESLVVELAPADGELLPLVVAQIARGKALGLVPVVEFYADWCAPCVVFQKGLDQPPLRDALRGTLLLRANMDDWHDKLKGTGYVVPSIPVFHLVKPDGRPSGKSLDAGSWSKPTPETMARSIAKLLGRG